MKTLDHSWQFFLLLLLFFLCGLYKAITFISTKLLKSSSSTTTTTNHTPISLEIKVTLPTRVIFAHDQTLRRFDPSELVHLPKNRLGEGSLGTLYKLVLDCGMMVTIRKVRKEITCAPNFEDRIRFFGGIRDDSRLLPMHFGFWYGGEVFVIHDYLCLGSLEELLHGKSFEFSTNFMKIIISLFRVLILDRFLNAGSEGVQFTPLSWQIRQQIALGAAKSVALIHSRATDNGEPLVCGVIKSSNLLIHSDFSPRLCSYETPYLISPSTIIRRNCGRMAPELTRTRSISKRFTQASDVYSFGILLLEIITGKKPSVTNLGQYVSEKRKREGPKGVPDKRMHGVTENVSDMIMVAGTCLSCDPKKRPSMEGVVETIQAILE